MPFTFDATVGGATANSLTTVEFADEYFGASVYAAQWPATSAGADLVTKQQALATATRELDRLNWQGQRTNWNVQRLQWPRVGLEDRDGNYLASDSIPREIQEATCELALYYLQIDPDTVVDESLKQFKRLKIANVIDLEMRDGLPAESEMPARVIELISRWQQVSGFTRVLRA
jgi:hypothetical protein